MTYDLAIIGGGPAGAAAAVYAARKRLRTIVITKDWLGQSYDSNRIENWVGTVGITGLELAKNLETHAKAYAEGVIDFKEGELATKVEKDGSMFKVTSSKSNIYAAKTILITSGSSRRKLAVPGALQYENKGVTYCASCDGPLYTDADTVVIGGGNAGFETCAQLLAYCKSVTLLNRSDSFKADPATIEAVLKNPKMKVIMNAVPKEVKGDKFVTSIIYTDSKSKVDPEVKATGIFVEIGSLPNTDFVKDLVKLDKFNHIVTDPRNQMTSTPGIWAAGDCTDGLYHQNNIAAGDAVKALEDIYLFVHKNS